MKNDYYKTFSPPPRFVPHEPILTSLMQAGFLVLALPADVP